MKSEGVVDLPLGAPRTRPSEASEPDRSGPGPPDGSFEVRPGCVPNAGEPPCEQRGRGLAKGHREIYRLSPEPGTIARVTITKGALPPTRNTPVTFARGFLTGGVIGASSAAFVVGCVIGVSAVAVGAVAVAL